MSLSVQFGEFPTWMVLLCMSATALFYTAHWQTYVSGTLKFSRFDVTEMQDTIIIMHLISAIFGVGFWNITLPMLGIRLKMIPLIATTLNEIFVLFCDLKMILAGGAGKNGSTVAVSISKSNWKVNIVIWDFWLHTGYLDPLAGDSNSVGIFLFPVDLFEVIAYSVYRQYFPLHYYVWFRDGQNNKQAGGKYWHWFVYVQVFLIILFCLF